MSTISRRGAIGRLFTLGAGATAALALPVATQAAPVVPIAPGLPDWLTADPEMLPYVERFARAIAAYPEPARPETGTWPLTREDWLEWVTSFAENAGRAIRGELDYKGEPKPKRIPDERVAVVRFDKLNRNDARRLRRHLANLPTGPEHPQVHYRRGERRKRGWDFLDVASPERPVRRADYDWPLSPYHYAHQIAGEALPKVAWKRDPEDVYRRYSIHCSHGGWSNGNEKTMMLAYPDGRLATYVHEAMP